MIVSTFWLAVALVLLLMLLASVIYAARMLTKSDEYNRRLFMQVLEEKASNEKLGAIIRNQQARRAVKGFGS